jgi:hypothetical protein
VKRRPGSSMFMDTLSWLVNPASILLAIFFLDGGGRTPVSAFRIDLFLTRKKLRRAWDI